MPLAPQPRPPISVYDDGQTRIVLIDTAQEAGRAALARWSHIPDDVRAKWANPWVPRSMEELDAQIAAYRASVAAAQAVAA